MSCVGEGSLRFAAGSVVGKLGEGKNRDLVGTVEVGRGRDARVGDDPTRCRRTTRSAWPRSAARAIPCASQERCCRRHRRRRNVRRRTRPRERWSVAARLRARRASDNSDPWRRRPGSSSSFPRTAARSGSCTNGSRRGKSAPRPFSTASRRPWSQRDTNLPRGRSSRRAANEECVVRRSSRGIVRRRVAGVKQGTASVEHSPRTSPLFTPSADSIPFRPPVRCRAHESTSI